MDGGGAGAGPSSLAVAKGSVGRQGGAAAAGAGGQHARPGAGASLQQQQGRRVIRWERFLPRRSLRVLLVEQDDSTRHVVTALLRKCSYHVAAVADGLKAWDVLNEKSYNFDLVLSEAEVPSLSGISLLCKIMANELFKNIPVIMMSSHDSVSVVFRCMQKGAVDFLVKPVRKNELRNLWQHVWRRHCSTSFANGPENMPNNQTVSENMSDNNAASNNVSANAGKGSRTGESCDGGDDQSSDSKPLTRNESSKEQGIALPVDNKNSARVMKSQSQQLDDDDIATLANASKNHDDDKTKDSSPSWELSLRRPQPNGCEKNGFQEKNILNHCAASAFSRYVHTGICAPDQKSGSSSATIYIRTRENADKCWSQFFSHESQNERPTASIPDRRLESSQGYKEEAKMFHQISSSNDDDDDAEPPSSVPSGEDICTGYSATKNHVSFPHPQLGMMPLLIPVGAVPFQSFCSGYGPILQPMFHHEPMISPHGSAALKQAKCLTSSDQPVDYGNHVNTDVQPTAFHSCEEHHPCLLELRKNDDTVDMEHGDPRRCRPHECGSEENTDQSGSYSQDVINGGGSNGNSVTAEAAVNMRTAFECSNESGLQNYRGKGVDLHHSHRESALIKFRLKRKDRCFEKKVRYHSRKMLAEQRPRVKGQFVRQAIVESNMTATEVNDRY